MEDFRPGSLAADAAMRRLQQDFADLDSRRFDIIITNIGLEREVSAVLHARLARPQQLEDVQYGARLKLLSAMCPDNFAVAVVEAITRFNTLRNSAAHGHNDQRFDGRIARLKEALEEIVGAPIPSDAHFGIIGMHLAAALHLAFELEPNGSEDRSKGASYGKAVCE